MGCSINNTTPAIPISTTRPAIAPGAEAIDPVAVARRLVERFGPGAMPARVGQLVPGFDKPFFQAGLAGYSDAAMRIIARRHGCPYCVTEALLDRTILAGGRGFAKADLGELHDNVPGGCEDQPLAGQLMGSDPAEMAAAALKLIEQGRRHDKDYRRLAYQGQLSPGEAPSKPEPDTPSRRRAPTVSDGEAKQAQTTFSSIDVNLACPVKKIARKARGGHWLTQPEGAITILHAVREAVPASIPTTLKIRRGFDDTPEMVENFWKIYDAAHAMGYAWATIHARTVTQKYIGPSRWDLLRDIVTRARIHDPDAIVFGSGDIWQAEDIFRMIQYTGVTGVSVARGCIGNPWIFAQANAMLMGQRPVLPTLAQQRQVLEQHFALALQVNAHARKPEVYTGRVMRKFGIRFAQHHPQSEQVRQRFIKVKSLEDWQGVLKDMYHDNTGV